MFCSTVIPTVARPTLARAVESVLSQTFATDDFEIIVVNDSGQPLPPDDWQRSDVVRIIHTNRRERSVARNAGAATAQGRYLHFLDDDDWLSPDALQHFWTLSENSGAAWLYGSTQLVDRHGTPIIQLHHGLNGNCFAHAMAGEWVPLQSSLIRTDAFFAVGGFDPLITGPEDTALLRRILLHGDLAETDHLVAYIAMGQVGSTTDYGRHAEMSRWSRERTLDAPGVLGRFRTSAGSSYLQGRILRVYLTSVLWNLQHGRPFTAASRALFGLAAAVLAGRHVVSPSYWHALTKAYENKTFIRGFEQVRGTARAER